MTYQPSFSQAEFADKKKITRRERFLARMEEIIPWASLLAVLEPFYPKGERSIEDFQRSLIEKRKDLLQFLDLAIRNHLPVICSL